MDREFYVYSELSEETPALQCIASLVTEQLHQKLTWQAKTGELNLLYVYSICQSRQYRSTSSPLDLVRSVEKSGSWSRTGKDNESSSQLVQTVWYKIIILVGIFYTSFLFTRIDIATSCRIILAWACMLLSWILFLSRGRRGVHLQTIPCCCVSLFARYLLVVLDTIISSWYQYTSSSSQQWLL